MTNEKKIKGQMTKEQAKCFAQYKARTRVQLNTNELTNLLIGYEYYLQQYDHVKGNSLTIKLRDALKQCNERSNVMIRDERRNKKG